MFLFIGGIQPRTVNADQTERVCPNCGRPTLRLKRSDEYLSLFFIPLFPVRRGPEYLLCETCGYSPDAGGGPPSFERRCPKCRRPLERDYPYCPYCGTRLGGDPSEKNRPEP
jgi:RNA polymerase subunit RPABC4/transcription elongation factor Spt4